MEIDGEGARPSRAAAWGLGQVAGDGREPSGRGANDRARSTKLRRGGERHGRRQR
jgi:hypothetical protein